MKKIIVMIIVLSLFAVGCEQLQQNNDEQDGNVSYVDVSNITANSDSANADSETDETLLEKRDREREEKRKIGDGNSRFKDLGYDGSEIIVLEEGETFKVNIDGFDADADNLTYFFKEPLDKNGEWETSVKDVGMHTLTVGVSDGVLDTTREIYVKVIPKNRPPVLEEMDDIIVMAGEIIYIEPIAKDPNGDELTYVISGLTSNSIYRTKSEDVGEHEIYIEVSDGKDKDNQTIKVSVQDKKSFGNDPPIIQPIPDILIKEGQSFTIKPVVSDPDGDEIVITYEGLDDQASYQADFDDAGEYVVKVVADDGTHKVFESVKVTITNVNRAPQLDISFD